MQTSQQRQAKAVLALHKSRKQLQRGHQWQVQQSRKQQPLRQQPLRMGQLSDWAVSKCPPTSPIWEAEDQSRHKRYKERLLELLTCCALCVHLGCKARSQLWTVLLSRGCASVR